ncbi:MAG: hypothetical protein PV347_00495 [Rickettsiaceae bacterium]|nr:hypothetical protein [Rickettsiaceae bacterium]
MNELITKGLVQRNEDFNVKLLREGCVNYANKYKDEIIKDAVDYSVSQENVAFPSLGYVDDKKGNRVQDKKESFNKYLRSIKKTDQEAEYPI